ncbi:hypothetical protein [Fulvivirga lutea]|uniref:Uncharacterized protein n=1 Tax=Fulvivirga lutea TaxID=2810512 RepID=A0A974WJ51_9BACT|nr:hypothetical protein JR347_07325 [Fulvivirga lutea]
MIFLDSLIFIDWIIGYGLKYSDKLQLTHLGRLK